VKVFDPVIARTGFRDHEATPLGHKPLTVTSRPHDHKAYYPGAHPITISVTGDVRTGQLLGAQSWWARSAPRSANGSTSRPPPCSTR